MWLLDLMVLFIATRFASAAVVVGEKRVVVVVVCPRLVEVVVRIAFEAPPDMGVVVVANWVSAGKVSSRNAARGDGGVADVTPMSMWCW